MPLIAVPGMRPVRMGELSVDIDRRKDGTAYVRSRAPLGSYPRSLIDRLDHWARLAPDRVLFADRGPAGAWRTVTYGEAARRARSVGQFLLHSGVSIERPLVILSGNSIEHALLALGAMTAGVPFAPVSPAYSLVSSDHSKLKHIFDLLTPGLVYAADGKLFERALAAETAKRGAFREELAQLLAADGLLVLPTVPGAAPLRDASFDDLQAYRERALRLLCLSGLSGFPQITLPLGKVDGAPFGISLIGPAGSDRVLIRLGRSLLETAGAA